MRKKKISRAGERVRSTRPSAGSTAPRRRVARKTPSDRQPKTAYDLCELVAQHIEEEPRRYSQNLWGHEEEEAASLPQPTCGTVCCRAGWVVALHDGPAALQHVHISTRSNEILGLSEWETDPIYYDKSMDVAPQGTKKYAHIGAAGLRRWAEVNAEHLKSRLLKDVPKLKGGRWR